MKNEVGLVFFEGKEAHSVDPEALGIILLFLFNIMQYTFPLIFFQDFICTVN